MFWGQNKGGGGMSMSEERRGAVLAILWLEVC